MNIHYKGQTKCARKMMIEYYHLKPEDVAMMDDDEIITKLEKDFVALEMQNDSDYVTNSEEIILINKECFNNLCSNHEIFKLMR